MSFLNCETFERYVDNPKGNILLIHGFASKFQRRIFLAKVFEDYNFFAINLPAHGQSKYEKEEEITVNGYLDIISGYIKSLNLKELIIYGHSMGGGLALITAYQFKDMIQKIILEAPLNTGVIQRNEKMDKQFAKGPTILAKALKVIKTTTNADNFFNPSVRLFFSITNNSIIMNIWDKEQRKIWSEKLDEAIKGIDFPILLLLSEKDKFIHFKETQDFFNQNYNTKLVTFKDCGHNILIDSPILTTRIVKIFLDHDFNY